MTALRLVSETQRIVIDPGSYDFVIERAGPPGPPGPPGSGGSPIAYTHVQAVTSSSWVINHNLNYFPNVMVIEQGTNSQLVARIIHHSPNQVEIQFNISRAGTAYLS